MKGKRGKVKGLLTAKQRRFVEEYLRDQNATQAAIRAGYSKRNADTIAVRLVRKSQVKAAIEARFKQIEKKTDVTVEMIVNGLRDIAQYGEKEGPRVAAWSTLAKIKGMLVDRQRHEGHDGGPIEHRHTFEAMPDDDLIRLGRRVLGEVGDGDAIA